MMVDEIATIREEYESIAKMWRRTYFIFRYLHYVLGLVAVLSSVVVVAGPELGIDDRTIRLFAVVTMAATGTNAFMAPHETYSRFRRAWSLLRSALVRHRLGLAKAAAVIDAYNQGEAIINEPPSVSSPSANQHSAKF
jgi:hypothetical protein